MPNPQYLELTVTLSALQVVAAHLHDVERSLVETPSQATADQVAAEIRDAIDRAAIDCGKILENMAGPIFGELPGWIQSFLTNLPPAVDSS